jgi:hypothetical protein
MTPLREGSDKGGLRGWFEGGGWDRYDSKGNKIGKCGGRKKGEAKPKCFSREKAAALGKKGRAKAVKRKRREDPNASRRGKPINTPSTPRGLKMRKDSSTDVNQDALSKLAESLVLKLLEKAKKDACYHKVKASAKVWPSAYASGRLVQCRKKGASNYGKSNSSTDIEGDSLTEIRGKRAHQRVMRAQRAAKTDGVQRPFDDKVSAKDFAGAEKYIRRKYRGGKRDAWSDEVIRRADAENRAQQQHSSTKIIGNSILEALKYLLETGETKRRNKARKKEFEKKVGKLALAHERSSEGGRVSRGPRNQLSKRKAQRGAENVAAGRAVRAGQRTSGYERSPELTKRIRTAGRKAAIYTPDDDDKK